MNPRLSKELRVLRPALVLSLTAGVLPFLFRGFEPGLWKAGFFILGALMMGAESFGMEFHQRTLGALLAQPQSRARLWLEKMQALALTLGVACAGILLGTWILERSALTQPEYSWLGLALIPVTILATTPFWTLLFRNTLVGGVLSLVMPGLILGANEYVHERWGHDPAGETRDALVLMAVYAAACCWGSYRRFGTLQLVDGAPLDLRLPRRLENWLARPFGLLAARMKSPGSALLKKELRIQQVSFVIAGLFVVAAVLAGLLFQVLPPARSDTGVALLICCYVFYIPLLPLVVGTSAFAEEKAWGVADWQLILPVTARKQWRVKVLVAFGLSVGLGILLPVGLALLGRYLVGDPDPANLPAFHGLRQVLGPPGTDGELAPLSVAILTLLCGLLGHGAVTAFALYAGAICGNTARALVTATGLMVATGYLIAGTMALAAAQHEWLVMTALIFQPSASSDLSSCSLLGVELILLLGLLLSFSYRCYRTRDPVVSILRMQIPLLIAVLFLFTMVFVTFYRTS